MYEQRPQAAQMGNVTWDWTFGNIRQIFFKALESARKCITVKLTGLFS